MVFAFACCERGCVLVRPAMHTCTRILCAHACSPCTHALDAPMCLGFLSWEWGVIGQIFHRVCHRTLDRPQSSEGATNFVKMCILARFEDGQHGMHHVTARDACIGYSFASHLERNSMPVHAYIHLFCTAEVLHYIKPVPHVTMCSRKASHVH